MTASILVIDIEGFGDPRHDDGPRSRERAALSAVLREAFLAAAVPWDACERQDRGDGVLFAVEPEVPTARLVEPLLGWLDAALTAHNRRAEPVDRFRLRLSLHVGDVGDDGEGPAGVAVVHACRLLEAQPLRTALRHASSDLAAVVSDEVYRRFVRCAAAFHPATVGAGKARAWITLPAGGVPVLGTGPGARAGGKAGGKTGGRADGPGTAGVRVDNLGAERP